MTNNEDFFAFAYPALFILGALLSIIPAYIASKKNKNFWLWWISTASIFAILLFVVIKTETFSLLVYLLAILPIASILALLPKLTLSLKLNFTKDHLFFLEVFGLMFIIGALLYVYFLYPPRASSPSTERIYFAHSGALFLMACLGYTLFLCRILEKGKLRILSGILLTVLLASTIFLEPERAYAIGFLPNRIIKIDLLMGPVLTDLIYTKKLAGIFILFGLCSGLATFAVLITDKYKVVNKATALGLRTVLNVPSIHFSKNQSLSSEILGFVIFFVGVFKLGFSPNESWMFLWPIVYLCLVSPMFFLGFAGLILSSVVIAKSINQEKNPYATGIFLCGALGCWWAASTKLFTNAFGLPATLLTSYGLVSGFIALLLWVISDLLSSR